MSIDQSSKSNNYYIIRGSMLNYIRSYTVRKGNTKKGLLIGVLILSCTLMYYVFGYLDIFSFLSKEQSVNYRNTLNMAIDGNEFWIEKDKERGYQHVDSDKDVKLLSDNSTVHHSTCKDFFVIWPGDCIESHDYLDERIRTLSAQMIVMNSTLNFFTTDVKGCIWDVYSKVKVVLFNATQELELQGFQSVLGIIDRWDKTRFTRLSDILRLCLAYRHQMSYLDTDVHLLELKKSWYESEYVGAQMWSDSKNAIELTNAAFCISRNILKDMLEYQKKIVIRKKGGKKEKYFYTELGPSMFHHVSRFLLKCLCVFLCLYLYIWTYIYVLAPECMYTLVWISVLIC